MEWATGLLLPMADPVTKLAYRILQTGKGLAGLLHKQASDGLMHSLVPESAPRTLPLTPAMAEALKASRDCLLERDWNDAALGIYPTSLLFDTPWLSWARRYPLIWLDTPSILERRQRRDVKAVPDTINRENYPDYYLQTFHHQTDGYLSDHSATLYDLQVEILFNGTADVMRRRILAPLKRALGTVQPRRGRSLRVLDVATGTGRTLRQLRAALPDADLVGTDLSAAYLREANRLLSRLPGECPQLVRANAEALPFADDSFDAVSCVFLLHELPRQARARVLEQCERVLRPGGVMVLADSIQLADSPEFRTVMENFHRVFHEPYYKDYVMDDIDAHFRSAGFEQLLSESHFMVRVWSCVKAVGQPSARAT